jgi:Zn-dependent protease
MDRNHWIFWSLLVGRLFATEIRLSWMLPALALVLVIQCGWQIGLAFFGMIVLAVLLHEFGHVFAARWTGGGADEIVLSPLGGLAMAQPGPGCAAQFLTAGAGPLVNLLLCAALFPWSYAPQAIPAIFLPVIPVTRLTSEGLWGELGLLAFSASYLLLVINLLPVIPFDGGQMLQASLASRYPSEVVYRGLIYAGYGTAAVLMFAGILVPWAGLVLLGAIVLVVNILQSTHGGGGDFPDDSFMGYDFSQGYTSLERSSGTVESEIRKSSWQRWKERRRAKREQQARERQLQDEAQLDVLLAKVYEQGYSSLTFAEKRLLNRVSHKYRDRTKRQS